MLRNCKVLTKHRVTNWCAHALQRLWRSGSITSCSQNKCIAVSRKSHYINGEKKRRIIMVESKNQHYKGLYLFLKRRVANRSTRAPHRICNYFARVSIPVGLQEFVLEPGPIQGPCRSRRNPIPLTLEEYTSVTWNKRPSWLRHMCWMGIRNYSLHLYYIYTAYILYLLYTV